MQNQEKVSGARRARQGRKSSDCITFLAGIGLESDAVMSITKWQNDTVNPAGKIQCKKFNDAWAELSRQHAMYTEKSGVIGGGEMSNTFWSPFGGGSRADVTLEQERIGSKYGWTVSRANVNEIVKELAAALPALKAAIPVKDTRITAEQDAENRRQREAANAERENKEREKEAAFVGLYGEPERVLVEDGKMLIELHLCFDNSDIQSDYFDRHASLGPALLLVAVPKQAETERIARLAVARYPWLKDIEFEWHTEKYSMGHGNYLESKGHELPEEIKAWCERYRGGAITHAHWEVVFSSAGANHSQFAAKGYPGVIEAHWSDPKPNNVCGQCGKTNAIVNQCGCDPNNLPTTAVVVTFNEEKFGIEIRFPSRPAPDVMSQLKGEGWRWSRFNGCWYHRATEGALDTATAIAGLSEEKRAELAAKLIGELERAGDHGMEVANGIA